MTEENKQQALELEWLKYQLAASQQETKQAVKLLSGECLEFYPQLFFACPLFFICLLWITSMLPEVSSAGNVLSPKDGLMQLGALHQVTTSAMGVVFWALWPQEKPPVDQTELARCLQEARRRIRTWKISACQEGARQAWAML